jgi:hypothetical protein
MMRDCSSEGAARIAEHHDRFAIPAVDERPGWQAQEQIRQRTHATDEVGQW